jgi:hypothetical protein
VSFSEHAEYGGDILAPAITFETIRKFNNPQQGSRGVVPAAQP